MLCGSKLIFCFYHFLSFDHYPFRMILFFILFHANSLSLCTIVRCLLEAGTCKHHFENQNVFLWHNFYMRNSKWFPARFEKKEVFSKSRLSSLTHLVPQTRFQIGVGYYDKSLWRGFAPTCMLVLQIGFKRGWMNFSGSTSVAHRWCTMVKNNLFVSFLEVAGRSFQETAIGQVEHHADRQLLVLIDHYNLVCEFLAVS